MERRRSRRRLGRSHLVIAGIIIMTMILAPVVQYYFSRSPYRASVLAVGPAVYSMGDYVRELRSNKKETEAFVGQFSFATGPYQVLEDMIRREILRQKVPPKLGITVTEQDIDEELKRRLLPPLSPEETKDRQQLDREYKELLRERLSLLQIPEKEYRNRVKADILQVRASDILSQQIPQVQSQVHFLAILTSNADNLDKLKQRIKSGEDFGNIALDVSENVDSARQKGDFGWAPLDVFPELDRVLFGVPVGGISDVIKAPGGYYVVQVQEKLFLRAHLQAVLTDTEDKANEVIRRSRNGESFDGLMAQFTTDPALKAANGDLGKVGVGDHGGIFDRVIRGLPEGQTSDEIGTLLQGQQPGFYFVEVLERLPARPIDDRALKVLKQKALDAWLLAVRKESSVDLCPSGDCFSGGQGNFAGTHLSKVDWAIQEVQNRRVLPSEVTPTARPNPLGF